MPGTRHHVEKPPARPQNPAELRRGQGREAVDQAIHRGVRKRQVVAGRNRDLRCGAAAGCFFHGSLRQVDSCDPTASLCGDLRQRRRIVPLAAAGVQKDRRGLRLRQGQRAQGLSQRRIPAPVQKAGAGLHHIPVVAGVVGMLPIGRKQVHIALPGLVIAVSPGTGQAACFPFQRRPTDRTAKQTVHSDSPFAPIIRESRWFFKGGLSVRAGMVFSFLKYFEILKSYVFSSKISCRNSLISSAIST